MKPVKVLIADDDSILLQLIAETLSRSDDVEVVATATDGAEALRVLDERMIDVALLDVEMPLVDGLEVARVIKQRHLKTAVVMLTAFRHERFLDEALLADVQGFLTKDFTTESLVDAIQKAAEGQRVLAARPTEMLVTFRTNEVHMREDFKEFLDAIETMPARLKPVVPLLMQASSNKAIAGALGLSENTVREYVSEIVRLTGSTSRVDVAVRALNAGFQPPTS